MYEREGERRWRVKHAVPNHKHRGYPLIPFSTDKLSKRIDTSRSRRSLLCQEGCLPHRRSLSQHRHLPWLPSPRGDPSYNNGPPEKRDETVVSFVFRRAISSYHVRGRKAREVVREHYQKEHGINPVKFVLRECQIRRRDTDDSPLVMATPDLNASLLSPA